MSHAAAEADAVIANHLVEILKLPEQEALLQLPRLLRLLSDITLSLSDKQRPSQDTSSHAICTRIGSLLAGQSNAGRWIAVTIIQTLVGQATFNVVDMPAAWIRSMISLLGRPCTPSTKISVIISFTRIAILARPYANYMRETITPNLPQYLNNCYSLISFPDSPCRLAALDSLARLVTIHPTVFRPLENKLYSALRPMVLGTTKLDGTAAGSEEPEIAAQLWVRLHFAAPKGQSTSAWEGRIYDCIEAIHKLFDTCFRGVVEDWSGSKSISSKAKMTSDLALLSAASSISGISRASESAICLLSLLKGYIQASTATAVSIPIGYMTELCLRALLVSLSSEGSKTRNWGSQQMPNSVREPVCLIICDLQIAALQLLGCVSETIGARFLPFLYDTVQSIGWSFSFATFWQRKRVAIYKTMTSLLRIGGPSLEKIHMKSLLPIFRECCNDALPLRRELPRAIGKQTKQRANIQADFILGDSSESLVESPELRKAASDLLPLITSHTPEFLLPLSVRAAVDRAALISQNKEAMLNSVLYPPAQSDRAHPRASIMPHLARSFPNDSDVEGLVRPRMPAMLYDQPSANGVAEYVETDEEMEDEPSSVAESAVRQPLKRSSVTPPAALPSPKRARNAAEDSPTEAPVADAHLEALAAVISTQGLNASQSPTPYTNPFTRSNAPPPENQPGPSTIPLHSTINTTGADADDSSDDDFSVPELTIGADTEDEDEIP